MTELIHGHTAADLKKVDIIHHLAKQYGYKTHLEIVTTTTGLSYAQLDQSKFARSHRLMYRCSDDFDDGLKIDFRSTDHDLAACICAIIARNLYYDIIFVDGWHEYETAQRDLMFALTRLNANGTIVVHDCLPTNQQLASPSPRDGEWCGVSYKAFLDFVSTQDVVYYTVDTDYGCGVIYRNDRLSLAPRDPVIQEWLKMGNDFDAAFSFFQKHYHQLLNLISVNEFLNVSPRIK